MPQQKGAVIETTAPSDEVREEARKGVCGGWSIFLDQDCEESPPWMDEHSWEDDLSQEEVYALRRAPLSPLPQQITDEGRESVRGGLARGRSPGILGAGVCSSVDGRVRLGRLPNPAVAGQALVLWGSRPITS